MTDELGFDIVAHGRYSAEFDKAARKAQETALRIEAANLKVEKATKKATDADAKYEKGSLQSREAANRLSVAQLNLSKAMSASAANVDHTREKVDKLDVSEKKLDVSTKKTDTNSNRLSSTIKKLAGSIGTAALGALKGVGAIASLASVVVTAGLAVAKLAIATAHLAVATGPALAGLLPLAAGALLIKTTLVAAGPAMLKAISPLTEAWKKQTVEVGKLASAGLRPLAREFVKTNFPQIGAAMNSIATTANAAVTSFVKWADSAPGVKAIGQVVAGTAHMFERLAPAAVKVADSIVSLAGRASGVTFNAFSDGAGAALRKFSRFLDGISATDVHDAFDKIGSLARSAGKGFEAFGDGLKWAQDHIDTINQIRGAVAGLAIVVGIATGGWMIALGGAVTLLVMNWGKLTAAFQAASTWVGNLTAKFPSLNGPIDALGGAFDMVKSAASDFVDSVKPHLQPFLDRVGDAFIKLQPYITAVISVIGILASAFIRLAGPYVGVLLDGLGLLIDGFATVYQAAADMASKVLNTFADMIGPIARHAAKLHVPGAKAFAKLADDAKDAAGRIQGSLNASKTDVLQRQIDRAQTKINTLKGKKVKTENDKRALAAAERELRGYQRQINALYGNSVTIGINTVRTTSGSTAPGARGRAAGGPVAAGQPYIVGEHRPELFVPRVNGTIVSRVPAGFRGGGGSGRIVWEVRDGSSDEFSKVLVQLIRKHVRITGGNAQVALGRN